MKHKRKTEDIDGCIMVKTALMLSSYQSIVAINQIVIFLATLHSETSGTWTYHVSNMLVGLKDGNFVW